MSAALTLSCAAGAGSGESPQGSQAAYAVPPALDDGWETGRADAFGLDVAKLDAMTRAIRQSDWNIHAVLIERDGRLVYEEYFAGTDERWGTSLGRVSFDRTTKHDLRSVTKSVTSALFGTLVASGVIKSLDIPIVEYFPEYQDLLTPERRRITLAHTLAMTSGLEWSEELPYTDPRNDEIVMTRATEPLRYALDRKIVAAPGTRWNYNGGLTQVLAAIVERTSKTPLAKYAEARLFQLLGISDFEWVGNLAGMPSAASGLRLRPRDLAKFGSIFLHQGKWKGREILSADWVEASTRRRITLPDQTALGYGYQWWHRCIPLGSASVEARMGRGNGGQRVVVLPALGTVVTVLAGEYNKRANSEGLIADYILPAFQTPPRGTCSTEV